MFFDYSQPHQEWTHTEKKKLKKAIYKFSKSTQRENWHFQNDQRKILNKGTCQPIKRTHWPEIVSLTKTPLSTNAFVNVLVEKKNWNDDKIPPLWHWTSFVERYSHKFIFWRKKQKKKNAKDSIVSIFEAAIGELMAYQVI